MKKILIVAGDYYKDITKGLLNSALKKLPKNFKVKIIKVPGVFEIPVTISKNIKKFDAFIALGCVIRGETSHYDIVSNYSAKALIDLAINNTIPISNGILTVDNKEQALVRACKTKKNNGGHAAKACIELIESFNLL